jgi:hypothetical protein
MMMNHVIAISLLSMVHASRIGFNLQSNAPPVLVRWDPKQFGSLDSHGPDQPDFRPEISPDSGAATSIASQNSFSSGCKRPCALEQTGIVDQEQLGRSWKGAPRCPHSVVDAIESIDGHAFRNYYSTINNNNNIAVTR